VEDDSGQRKLLRKRLEGIGLQVIDVGDGRSAIRELTQNTFDIVCLDLMLPELSGYDICEFIRSSSNLKHIPVLVVSARALPEDQAYAERAGASAYFVKPFETKTFLTQVNALLKGYRLLEVNSQ
jgi:two-component system chemotaxis response regulator CheY